MTKDMEKVKSLNDVFAYISLVRFAFKNLQDYVKICFQKFAFIDKLLMCGLDKQTVKLVENCLNGQA